MVFIAMEAIAVMLFVSDHIRLSSFEGRLERTQAGEEDTSQMLVVTEQGQDQDISVHVSSMTRSLEEKNELIDLAMREIEETVLGENESPDMIYEDLDMRRTYQEGTVSALWKFDNNLVIDTTGRLIRENIEEDTLVQATCTLTCEDSSQLYIQSFNIIKPTTATESGFKYLLEKSLEEMDAHTRDKEVLVLPDRVGDVDLKWKLRDSNRGIQLALFGIVTSVMLYVAEKEDIKRKKRDRIKRMETDYPEIVSMLSLYVGAGISVKGAFTRIAASKKHMVQAGDHPGFEGVLMLTRDMDDGKGEIDAYKDFGKRMEQKDYRKLSLLLTQNLRKGSNQLIDQLEKEEHAAFEERKTRAKIAGEEASTKLLLPMMGLLIIVIVVLIFPAIQGIGF